MSEYKAAIDRLNELAEFNESFASKIEAGEIRFDEKKNEREVEQLIKTYRYWFQCCQIAAWLLENDSIAQA